MNKYRAFIKVVETGNITRAAREMGYSQPGVSHMLDALEGELGFPLLIRGKDSIQPTEDGKKILYYCYQIVKNDNTLRETAKSIHGLMAGTIRIGGLNSTLLSFVPRVVSRFSKTYSSIDLLLYEHSYGDMVASLQNGTIDLAFMTNNGPQGYDFLPLFNDPICVAVHKSHPFANQEKIQIKQLNGCDFIMPTKGWDDLVQMVMDVHPFKPNIRHYTASDTAGIALAAENMGVYILAKLQLHNLQGDLVVLEFEENVSRSIGICTKSLKHTSPAIKEFIQMAQTMI